jgi:hypothetical protein
MFDKISSDLFLIRLKKFLILVLNDFFSSANGEDVFICPLENILLMKIINSLCEI